MRSMLMIALAALTLAPMPLTGQTTGKPEAMSLSGKPLYPIAVIANKAKLDADLAEAEKNWAANPKDPEALIWLGRRQAYLWRYQDAIATFSKGMSLFPDNAKLYRHRGHRYLTTRQLAKAQVDFETAAELVKNTPDEIEPDGAPNAAGKPRSTLKFNIWYHLGLTDYLRGNYAKAYADYVECMKVSNNDDSIVATSDWMWMTLMRLNRKAEAAKVLERITAKMDILENDSYHRRLLMYKGLAKPEALLDASSADATTIATQGYGVGNYYYVMGDTKRAREVFEKVTSGAGWNAFGYLAAEADLLRIK